MEARIKLSENGRILIPMAYREAMNLKPGDDLLLQLVHNEIHLISLKNSVSRAQQQVKKYKKKNQKLTQLLKQLRKQDQSNE